MAGAVVVILRDAEPDVRTEALTADLVDAGFEAVAVVLDENNGPPTDPLDEIDSALTRLVADGWSTDQVGVIGVGRGGRAALVVAAHRVMGAVVSIEPEDIDSITAVVTPWLGLFGPDAPSDLDVFGERLRAGSSPHTEVVRYGHRFTAADAGGRSAAFDARQRCVEWFDRRLARRPSRLAVEWSQRAGHRSPTGPAPE
jgi:carboxymethylenebutenolidase